MGPKDGQPVAAQEEWAVVILEGRALDPVGTSAKGAAVLKDEPERMVGICPVRDIAGQPLTLCDDESEAYRVAETVSEQLHLPLYDGADKDAFQVDAGEYADLEADGPDPYPDQRNAANRWAIVMAHDERYCPTDFATIVSLDDWIYPPEFIVSQHPTEDAAALAAEDFSRRFGLPFPVEPGQFSADVPAAPYREQAAARVPAAGRNGAEPAKDAGAPGRGAGLLRFRIYPDHWKLANGPEPSLGPIEAPDARSAYHAARDQGMYPAGQAFGLRAVALDAFGQLAPERGVWGGTQETPEWAAYERSLGLRKEVESTPDTLEASVGTSATEEKEAHPMKIEARNMKLLDNRTDNLHAICDVNLGGDFVIQGVRVVAGKDGKPFVSLPAYQDRNGDYHEVAHPVTAKAREVTNQVVLKEFERQVLAKLPQTADGPER